MKAGLPVVMHYERWTREDVIAGIRRLYAAGTALNANIATALGHRKLVKAATRHFKTWRLACYTAVPGYRPLLAHWTIHRVVERIKRRYRDGESVRSTEVQREEAPLTDAARRLGLTWTQACRRAGIPTSAYAPRTSPSRVRWTHDTIRSHLRAAAAAGTPLLVRNFPGGLVTAIYRRWPSWEAAIASARLVRQYQRDVSTALGNRLGGAFIAKPRRS